MSSLLDSLQKSLEELSEQATEADLQLAQLKNAGMGRFNYILQQDAGFNARSNRFQPYLVELTEQYLKLPELAPEKLQAEIVLIVKKMEVLFKTIGQFKQSIAKQSDTE